MVSCVSRSLVSVRDTLGWTGQRAEVRLILTKDELTQTETSRAIVRDTLLGHNAKPQQLLAQTERRRLQTEPSYTNDLYHSFRFLSCCFTRVINCRDFLSGTSMSSYHLSSCYCVPTFSWQLWNDYVNINN